MSVTVERPTERTAIRPFRIEVPEADLEDMRARIRSHPVARQGNRRRPSPRVRSSRPSGAREVLARAVSTGAPVRRG